MDPQALTLRPAVGLTTSHSKAMFGTTITFLILATIFVALRAWAGKLRRTPYRIDDYLVFGALVWCIHPPNPIQGRELKQSPNSSSTTVKQPVHSYVSNLTVTALILKADDEQELFLGGAGHHVEELHPRNLELTLQVSRIPWDQCPIAAC